MYTVCGTGAAGSLHTRGRSECGSVQPLLRSVQLNHHQQSSPRRAWYTQLVVCVHAHSRIERPQPCVARVGHTQCTSRTVHLHSVHCCDSCNVCGTGARRVEQPGAAPASPRGSPASPTRLGLGLAGKAGVAPKRRRLSTLGRLPGMSRASPEGEEVIAWIVCALFEQHAQVLR